jgi:sulfopyruvate decarboxylase alpha subunit
VKLEWPRKIVSLLKSNDICSISFIPDSVIGQILKEAEKDSFFQFTTLAREEEGIGIIAGEYLGGRYGVLMMQSAGLGNCVNALASLAIPYQIPFLMLISQRGELGEFNACHVVLGKALRRILEALGIQHYTVGREDEVETIAKGAGFKQALTVDTLKIATKSQRLLQQLICPKGRLGHEAIFYGGRTKKLGGERTLIKEGLISLLSVHL